MRCFWLYGAILVATISVLGGIRADEIHAEETAPDAEAVRQGITASLREQIVAWNKGDTEKVLAGMCSEVPDIHDLRHAVRVSWDVNPSFCRLDAIEVLTDSFAIGSAFEYPYATVLVSQSFFSLPAADERNDVFRRKCLKDDSDANMLAVAERLGFGRREIATSSVELLYKHEGGQWRLVNGLTSPVPVGKDAKRGGSQGFGVPFQQHFRPRDSRSVFN